MISLLVLLLAILVVLLVALLFLLYRTSGPPISSAKDKKDTKSSSTSSSLSPESGYDVFLSFKGNDTPTNFVDDLSRALMGKGFYAFMAEEPSKDDKTIPKELLEVIEESKFAIVILSRNYVSSTRCLDELVKIIECREYRKKAVLPLFYQVDISEVRRETGHFKEVFVKHENCFQHDRVQKWRQALKVLIGIIGIDLKQSMDSQVIPVIVRWISKELKYDFLTRKIKLVDADSRVNKVKSYLDLESNDSSVVGIWGMAGIGKTTIAKQVFADIRDQFEVYSFVPNIKEQLAKHTVVHLQKILIRSLLDSDADIETDYEGISILRHRLRFKKVLIVLDDVASIEQLESLVGKSGERGYFGPKSRIIITTRDKHVLSIYAVKNRCLQVDKLNDSGMGYIYTVNKLNLKESLQLLCLKAFGQNHPPGNFNDLCDKVVEYAEGLPLALEVLGSFLYGRPREVWLDALSVLRKELMKEIFVPLRISYDGLTALEKNIFLDIACFFVGEDQNRVSKILDACGFKPIIGISVLVEKSLITVEKNALLVHGLVRQMGWEIIRQESPQEPNKRTRLGQHEDIYDILKEKKETQAVEGIILRNPENKKIDLDADAFLEMSNLRLLKIYNADILGLPRLPHNLRLLEWDGYPLNELTLPNKLVELRLCNSRIEVFLTSSLPLKGLVVLDLSYCLYLTKTPDFKMFPNLETLIFEGCSNLFEVDPSIMHLQNLGQLNFKDCKNLLSLSNELWSMTTLRTLDMSGCSNLHPLPRLPHNLRLLEWDGYPLNELTLPNKLVELRLCNSRIEVFLTASLPLKGLVVLDLSYCLYLTKTPDFKMFPYLEMLIFEGCSNLLEVDPSIMHLQNLSQLNFKDCKNLLSLSNELWSMTTLRTLDLSGCSNLPPLPKHNLKHLKIILPSIKVPEVDDFQKLIEEQCMKHTLQASNECIRQDMITENMGSLYQCDGEEEEKTLATSQEKLPTKSLSIFHETLACTMKSLSIFQGTLARTMKSLSIFPETLACTRKPLYPSLSLCLNFLGLRQRPRNITIKELPMNITIKELPRNIAIKELQRNITIFSELQRNITIFSQLQRNIPKFITILNLIGTPIVTVPESIEVLSVLKSFKLEDCKRLETLPGNIYNLKRLEVLHLNCCPKLKTFPEIYEAMESLRELVISESAIQELPSHVEYLIGLTKLSLNGCKNLKSLPRNIRHLVNLQLFLCKCESLESL